MIEILVAAAISMFTVLDGDTVRYDGITIRILNIDAPEIHGAKCAYESLLAQSAKRRLTEILLQPGDFEIIVGDPRGRTRDRYNRLLAKIEIEGVDVGETLIKEGLARPWTGRREPWC